MQAKGQGYITGKDTKKKNYFKHRQMSMSCQCPVSRHKT